MRKYHQYLYAIIFTFLAGSSVVGFGSQRVECVKTLNKWGLHCTMRQKIHSLRQQSIVETFIHIQLMNIFTILK